MDGLFLCLNCCREHAEHVCGLLNQRVGQCKGVRGFRVAHKPEPVTRDSTKDVHRHRCPLELGVCRERVSYMRPCRAESLNRVL